MKRYHLSSSAERDIEQILAWTEVGFGPQAKSRYQALIIQAIRDVATDPLRAGCVPRTDLRDGVRTYHLRSSRASVKPSRLRVKHPRHFLILRIVDEETVEVSRVVHDRMDLLRNLPPDLLD
jgi:toxin ParE1/3/4